MSKKKKYLHKLEKEWKKTSTLSNTAELAETQNIATDSLLQLISHNQVDLLPY
jgi:hypothetical protein